MSEGTFVMRQLRFVYENPLAEVRWRGGKLQQRWLIKVICDDGNIVDMKHEWRDVPVVEVNDEEDPS